MDNHNDKFFGLVHNFVVNKSGDFEYSSLISHPDIELDQPLARLCNAVEKENPKFFRNLAVLLSNNELNFFVFTQYLERVMSKPSGSPYSRIIGAITLCGVYVKRLIDMEENGELPDYYINAERYKNQMNQVILYMSKTLDMHVENSSDSGITFKGFCEYVREHAVVLDSSIEGDELWSDSRLIVAAAVGFAGFEYEPKFGITHDGTPILKQLFLLPEENTAFLDEKSGTSTTESPESGSVVWQLFSHCSKGFLQIDKIINARGSSSSPCSTNFIVRVEGAGSVVLRHLLTKKYICFNRRKRITTRIDSNDIKCHFIEKINSGGYTLLESAWWPGLFLGFNRKGRFQEPSGFRKKYRCFLFSKLEHFSSSKELRRCLNQPKNGLIRRHRDEQSVTMSSLKIPDPAGFLMDKSLLDQVRNMLLKKVEA
ncbi:hypothetical protein FO519_001280 [Halicephalobus sp. NKZ332]|nr:hypothetical protein FO519_001280 [Halicephalobus sp. NKZ332]